MLSLLLSALFRLLTTCLQKLGAFKYENRPWNDNNQAMAAEPESPGETPKSIRPIPHDLDIMLRAACTGVVRNNKPSHEYHKGGKAQLDYATIRRGGGNNPAPAPRKPDPAPAALAKLDSNENRFSAPPQRDSTLTANLASPEKSNRVSHISASTENPPQTGDGTQVQVQRSRAQSRADQIMAGSPPKALALQRERTNSHHSRSQSTPQGTWAFPAPNLGSLRRPKAPPRAQSMETSPQTKSTTGNSWSDGTKETVSSQAAPSQTEKKTSDVDAEWMNEDSERRLLLRQQAFAETALSRHTTRIEPKPEPDQEEEKENIAPVSQVPALVATIPERKPVPTADLIASPESASIPTSPVIDSATEDSLSIDGQTTREELPPFSYPQRSDSRGGRARTRGTGVPMNSRAVSRARSITREVTREVKSFVRNASRNASRTRQPRVATDEPLPRSRRPSISRTATNVKEYFRPGTSTKQSLDVPRSAANLKSRSHESFVSTRSDSAPAKDTPMQRSQRSSRYQNATLSTGRNSPEADTDATISHHYTTSSDTLQQKRQVDLNRALPPLPRLGSWHADAALSPSSTTPASPRQAPEPPKQPQGSDVPSPTQEGMTTLKRLTSRESRSPLPSPKMGAVHDYVALRMGAAVARQPSKAKPPRERGNPNLPSQSSRPGISKRVPTDPRDAKVHLNDSGSPAAKTHAQRVESPASRRRSKSLQEPNPTDLSEKLRKASANAPDGRPIHAVGQAKLINTTSTRSQFDGLAGKIGRKLSTKRRNGPPTHPPPPPPPHLDLPQQKAKTTSSTPNGLSRANSTYHSKSRQDLTRKMSMEEYGHNYDGRFHKDNDNLMNPPPPVAVGGSKNSPRMNIGNFLPSKFQQQQQQQQQQSGSKKWWHLGLGNNGDSMDQVPQNGNNMDHANGSLGVRY
jgi:hypothetical protein